MSPHARPYPYVAPDAGCLHRMRGHCVQDRARNRTRAGPWRLRRRAPVAGCLRPRARPARPRPACAGGAWARDAAGSVNPRRGPGPSLSPRASAVPVRLPPHAERPPHRGADLAIVAVKAFHTAEAGEISRAVCGPAVRLGPGTHEQPPRSQCTPQAPVLTLQNGGGNVEALQRALGHRVLAGTTTVGAAARPPLLPRTRTPLSNVPAPARQAAAARSRGRWPSAATG